MFQVSPDLLTRSATVASPLKRTASGRLATTRHVVNHEWRDGRDQTRIKINGTAY